MFYIIFLGLVFWKANSRKVFALPAPVKKEISVVNLDADDFDSDDSETTPAVRKGFMTLNVPIALVDCTQRLVSSNLYNHLYNTNGQCNIL